MTLISELLARMCGKENSTHIMSYSLCLSDGNNWWMSGDEVSQWLDKLSDVMLLGESICGSASKLIFSRMRDKNNAVLSDVALSESRSWGPEVGWVSHDYPFIRVWRHNSIDSVICEIENHGIGRMGYANMRYSLQPIYQRSIYGGGLPFHAVLAALEGRGVLLAGHGNTGKSTCYSRLPDYWSPLCDDEALVVLDRQREYHVHPFPTWTDYLFRRIENTWDTQSSVPLSGIFFIEQSKTDEFIPVGVGESAVLISEAAAQVCERFWQEMDGKSQRKLRAELFDNACEMARAIPAFRLCVSLHGRFWEEIENALGWRTL